MSGARERFATARPRGANRLPRSFADRDPVQVAPELLGKLLQRGSLIARIVEVEAYRGDSDAASHAFRGKTARNATMFGPAGHLYVYFTYGMHYCANVVCWPEGRAGAVLLRALAPLSGIEAMAARRFGPQKPSLAGTEKAVAQLARPKPGAVGEPHRPAWRIEDLCSGPAKLCQAFGLDRGADGYDLISGEEGVLLLDDGTPLPFTPEVGTRIGLASNCASGEEPWRWWVPGEPSVSRRRNR